MLRNSTSRRGFLAGAGAGAAGAILSSCSSPEHPNFLTVTCEDLSPVLGCYGDQYARTPNLDRLAGEGIRFTKAFATAPVCTPARSCLITGVHAISLGTQNLRGEMPKPDTIPCYTEYLREAGYYCTNNVKEDYNFPTPAAAWDDSSNKAHWRNNPGGSKFFSIFNLMTTHQSQTRYGREKLDEISAGLPPEMRHDPDRIPLPYYYPDTPAVRLNMAVLYTQVTVMDQQVGKLLGQLEEDGLADGTIVIFYSDHGTGLPRGKRWPHDSGIHVPLIVRFPSRYERLAPSPAGSTFEDLVSFVDFPPTMLSLAGLPIPEYMQGRAFLGTGKGEPREYIHAARDRIDEVVEISRTVRDRRYQYIRNYTPHRPRMQRSDYSELTPIRQELRRLHREGRLSGDAAWLMAPDKPVEELYDLETDPEQRNNLADAPEQAGTLERLRSELRAWMLRVRDTGLLPEPELVRRAAGKPPYNLARQAGAPPLGRILDAAELVGRGSEKLSDLEKALADADPGVRYWGAVGMVALGIGAKPAREALRANLTDDSAAVRTAAAEALCHLGDEGEAVPVLTELARSTNGYVALHAAISLAYIGRKAAPAVGALEEAVERGGEPAEHFRYLGWALNAVRENLRA